MQHSTVISKLNLSRFDGLVIAALLGLALGTLLFIWRGNSVGLQVIATSPADGAQNVSARSEIRITFDQPLVAGGDWLTLTPAVSGTTRWQGETLIFSPQQPLAANTGYAVHLAAGVAGQPGSVLKQPLDWQFRTRSPQLLFIGPDEAGSDQLFTIDPADGERQQLTTEPLGVFDYQLSPDGGTIAYSAVREDGGSDLWAIDPADGRRRLLLACTEAMCSGATWASDGQRLLFEKRNLPVPGAAPGPPRLWWLDVAGGAAAAMFEDTQELGYGATWSPDGEWLAYVAPSSQGVQVLNLRDERSMLVPSRMGGLAVWSPQGGTFLVTDIQTSEAGFAVHLLKATPGGGELIDLTGQGEPVEDSSPAWSPDGQWIAFCRKVAGAAMGKQIWLMRADGSAGHFLTNEPDIHHGLPRWSPDGQTLAYQRTPLTQVNASPTLWLMDVASGQARQVVDNGNRPYWLP